MARKSPPEKALHLCAVVFFLFAADLLLCTGQGRAAFFRYIDKDGNKIYVDDKSKVPEQYLDQLKIYTEEHDHLTPEQRRRLNRQQRQKQEAARKASQARKTGGRGGPDAGGPETPVVLEGNKVMVPAVLGYRGAETEAMLVLDTGATMVALHREVAQLLDVEEFEKTRMRVVDGTVVDADMIRLDYIRIGPVTKKGLRASIIDHQGTVVSHQGLLGMNFLRGLGYRIDFERGVIRWRSPKGP